MQAASGMFLNHKSILVRGTQRANLGQILHHHHHIGSKTLTKSLSFEASKVQRTYHTRLSVGEELLLLFRLNIRAGCEEALIEHFGFVFRPTHSSIIHEVIHSLLNSSYNDHKSLCVFS